MNEEDTYKCHHENSGTLVLVGLCMIGTVGIVNIYHPIFIIILGGLITFCGLSIMINFD